MAYVPGYEYDIFISYTHQDNVHPVVPDKPGWVDKFEYMLLTQINNFLRDNKHKVECFRDHELRLSGKFSTQLEQALARCALFVCIPSINYVGSDWCLWELERFYQQAGETATNRIFKA